METTLRTWGTVKDRVHDVSGVNDPENWLFEQKMGIFYPKQRVEVKTVEMTEYEKLIDEHDPDMTDEELESLGIVVKYKKLIGDKSEFDIRDGCGHLVRSDLEEVGTEPKPQPRKIGF